VLQNAVFFTDTDHGYATGNGAPGNIILKTTDGRLTWSDTSYGSQAQDNDLHNLTSIQFTDSSTGYIYGWSNRAYELFFLKTTDSGASWNKVWLLGGVGIEGHTTGSMFFSGPDTGYVVYTAQSKGHAHVYKTTDGWTTSAGFELVDKWGWS
jgi:hypothetical protein